MDNKGMALDYARKKQWKIVKQIVLFLLCIVFIISGCEPEVRYVYVTDTIDGTNQAVTTTLPVVTVTQNTCEPNLTTVTTTMTHIITMDNIDTIQTTNVNDVIVVDTKELLDEYTKNEVAADLKYKNKKLQITDAISSISSTSSGPSINFTNRLIWSVYCYFDDAYSSQVAQFNTGQIITIQGTCTGKEFLGVILKDCILISQ